MNSPLSLFVVPLFPGIFLKSWPRIIACRFVLKPEADENIMTAVQYESTNSRNFIGSRLPSAIYLAFAGIHPEATPSVAPSPLDQQNKIFVVGEEPAWLRAGIPSLSAPPRSILKNCAVTACNGNEKQRTSYAMPLSHPAPTHSDTSDMDRLDFIMKHRYSEGAIGVDSPFNPASEVYAERRIDREKNEVNTGYERGIAWLLRAGNLALVV